MGMRVSRPNTPVILAASYQRLAGSQRLPACADYQPNALRTTTTPAFCVASASLLDNLLPSISNWRMNAKLCKKALDKVGNANVLTNIVSRRVRQLTSGSGALSRPLVANAENLGAADVALLEVIEDKMAWEAPEPMELAPEKPKKKARKH